ncbi:MAG: xylulokinase [Eubacteriales bacterium]
MSSVLGIDLGTSSVKAMLLDTGTGESAVAGREYTVDIPQAGYAEQSPEVWWQATIAVLRELKEKHSSRYADIAAIGFSGQMHGLVAVDESGVPLRPAIIWLDQRPTKQLDDIAKRISPEELGRVLHNRVFAGFALPSLLWVLENEPDIAYRIYRVMQPKDYIRFKMTGCIGTEESDASATGCFDTGKRDWAWEILQRFCVPPEIFPACGKSAEIAGTVTSECAALTGLTRGIPVVYGSGDQTAQSIGNGAVREGMVISNIGTGGQISTFSSTDKYDPQMRTHTFCHAIEGAYTIFGATLCAGMSVNWLKNKVLGVNSYGVMNQLATEVPAGSEGLLFLPYLSGERAPHMNPKAEGMFFGLKLCHGQGHLIRAAMEGVTFSLKDSLCILEEMGICTDRIIASGGGAASPVWLQIQADIFEKEIQVCRVGEQACLGACILAGVGAGLFASVQDACRQFVQYEDRMIEPIQENSRIYRREYERFKELYTRNKDLMGLSLK